MIDAAFAGDGCYRAVGGDDANLAEEAEGIGGCRLVKRWVAEDPAASASRQRGP